MITVAGIGPGGSSDFLFEATRLAMEKAAIIIGSPRQLELVPECYQKNCKLLPKSFAELEVYLKEHMEREILLLASGDPLLYGIGKWACKHFEPSQITILPGISSIQYLFSQARIAMEDCYITSSHGKQPDYELIFRLPKVALVTDAKIGPYELAQKAVERGIQAYFLIGENLSYPDENIRWFAAEEVPKEKYQMNVVVIVNER